MTFLDQHLLSVIVFLPIVTALLILGFPRGNQTGVRGFAIATSLVGFIISIMAYTRFDSSNPGIQLDERLEWNPFVWHPILGGRRRYFAVARAAHDVPHSHRDFVHLFECDRARPRIHGVLAVFAKWHVGRFCRHRHVPVLRLLGSHAQFRCISSSAFWGGKRHI